MGSPEKPKLLSLYDIGLGHIMEPRASVPNRASEELPSIPFEKEEDFQRELLYEAIVVKEQPTDKFGLTFRPVDEYNTVMPEHIATSLESQFGHKQKECIAITGVKPGGAAAKYNWKMWSFGQTSPLYLNQLRIDDRIVMVNGKIQPQEMSQEMKTAAKLDMIVWRMGTLSAAMPPRPIEDED